MSLKKFVLKQRVGPYCENTKEDVQTAQYLFNAAGLSQELGIEYFPVTGVYGPGLERAISVFQSVKVQGETRQNYRILAPGSATWGKLVESAKQSDDATEYWISLTPSQRERYSTNLQQLKVEKANWVPTTHKAMLALQILLNTYPRGLGWLQKLTGSSETGITLVQLALESIQLISFLYMVHEAGLGVDGAVLALKSLVGLGGEGVTYLQRVANAFSTGSLNNALKAVKGVLGKIGIFMILVKAGVYIAAGQWKLGFIEVVKGVVSVAVPIVGLIDAIFSVLDAIFPSLKSWPVYNFVRALNPADLVGNAVGNVFALIDLAWTAWGRGDWDVVDSIRKVGARVIEVLDRGLEALLDFIRPAWNTVVWIGEWLKGIRQKLIGYGLESNGRLRPALPPEMALA